jgi:methionyl-tRNA formyltransferase
MAGDAETGVTIHQAAPELDAGPVAAQRGFPVGAEEDSGAVYDRASRVAVELLDQVLPGPTFEPQAVEGVTYAEKIRPADRDIDWSQPVGQTVNRVRALSPHIGARGDVGGRQLIVWHARPATPDSLLVVAGVELVEVQPEGRRRMAAGEYLRGLRS